MRTSFTASLLALAACGGSAPAYLVYVRDAQGTVIAAVDDRGGPVWQTHDDAYGLRLASSGSPIPREFLDRPFDEETGFYPFAFRTYDPAAAQWLTPDPALTTHPGKCARDPQLCNPYAYAGGRPEEWPDPDGRWIDPAVPIDGMLVVGITAAFIGSAADAARAMSLFQRAVAEANTTWGRPIVIRSGTYARSADAPRSYTRFLCEFGEPGPSSFDPRTGEIHLRADFAAGNFQIALHESGHGGGARDGYFAFQLHGARVTIPLPDREDDVMAEIDPTQAETFSPEALGEMEDAKEAGTNNQGLTPPTWDEWLPGAPLPVANDPGPFEDL